MMMEAPAMPELKEVEGEIVSCIVCLVGRLRYCWDLGVLYVWLMSGHFQM